MERSITNAFLTATVRESGAELCSLRGADGMEYMWRADPDIWGRHAPILFPVVGKLAGDRYVFEGKRYGLGQHGFARDLAFEPVEETGDALAYRLLPSPETRERYPFEFALFVRYRLAGNALTVGYEVRNEGAGVMLFSIGAHPAFALAWGEGDRVEDYFLEFEREEYADTHTLDGDKLLSEVTRPILKGERRLPLRRDMFDNDALIFMDLKSERVSLRSRKHSRRLTVAFPGFPYLGIWAKPGAPYVCIEPWHGHVDPAGVDGLLVNKPGIIKLGPGERFGCSHEIIVEA